MQKAIRDYLPSSTSALKGRADLGEFEGQRIYHMDFQQWNPAERSQALAKAGIPGIKYLDGNSRDNGKGTSNYVIFDENLVKIIEENGRRVDNAPFSLAPRSQQDTEYLAAVEAGDSGSDNLIQLLRDAPESNRREWWMRGCGGTRKRRQTCSGWWTRRRRRMRARILGKDEFLMLSGKQWSTRER